MYTLQERYVCNYGKIGPGMLLSYKINAQVVCVSCYIAPFLNVYIYMVIIMHTKTRIAYFHKLRMRYLSGNTPDQHVCNTTKRK